MNQYYSYPTFGESLVWFLWIATFMFGAYALNTTQGDQPCGNTYSQEPPC